MDRPQFLSTLSFIFVGVILALFAPPTTVNSQGTQQVFCSGRAEIALVIDMSGSVQDVEMALKRFSVAFANSFSVSDGEIRFTVTAFSASNVLNLFLTGDSGRITNEIVSLSTSLGGTDMTQGINPGRANLNAGRSGIPRVMIVLSDGGHNVGGDVYAAINATRAAGIPMFSVGYETFETNTSVLSAIDPNFRLYSVQQLAGVVGETVRLVCKANIIEGAELEVITRGDNSDIPIDPIIQAELNRGITRVFDDGLVIARQPSGDLQIYTPFNCYVGSFTTEAMENVNLSNRYLVDTILSCGYRVDLWSLGHPACQLQINMYGPDGYDKVYRGERQECDAPSSTGNIGSNPASPTTPIVSEPSTPPDSNFGGVATLDDLDIANLLLDVFSIIYRIEPTSAAYFQLAQTLVSADDVIENARSCFDDPSHRNSACYGLALDVAGLTFTGVIIWNGGLLAAPTGLVIGSVLISAIDIAFDRSEFGN